MASTAPRQVIDLVERYQRNRSSYEDHRYNEAEVRREFLDPLFIALGWDVNNELGYAEPYKDVVHEYSLRTSGGVKTPDYSFRVGGTRKFFLEAKKPSVHIAEDSAPAYQLRRYAWSAKLPLSILSNFRETSVYDCRQEPTRQDPAATARTMYITCDELDARWDDIASIVSKEAVLRGSFDAYAIENLGRRGSLEVDDAFLREMQGWRKSLASHLASRNQHLTQRQLNYAVQQTLDRIVFLRICEDRGIEQYGRLRDLLKGANVYPRLCKLFRAADDRYNSGLFHFRRELGREDPDTLTLGLTIEDKPLKSTIKRLYYPDSPYAFDVLPLDILGAVYEQFLGQVIVLTGTHRAKIEDKPEVKKAGGVYYTPTHIVDYIVSETLAPLLDGKTPQQVRRAGSAFRLVDPACGSGSFLLSAYQYLLDWYLKWYVENDPARWSRSRPPRIRPGQRQDEWHLTTAERKLILLTHLFGVDIDPQAVEVTKLSLVLKVLEGESEETLHEQMLLFHERALPDLSKNVRCGNSLVGPDFYDSQVSLLSDEQQLLVNAFSWEDEFPEVMRAGGFKAVIGNPPWLMAGYYATDSLQYLREAFESAQGKFDLYYAFIERGCKLLSTDGRFAMIVPNKFFHTEAAESMRGWLSRGKWVRKVVDFGHGQVFRRATNYSCLLFLQSGLAGPVDYAKATPKLEVRREFSVPRKYLQEGPWYFHDRVTRALFSRLRSACDPLENLIERFGTGVQSGADRILMFKAEEARELGLEEDILRAVFRGRDIRQFHTNPDPKLLLFPYTEQNGQFSILSPTELRSYPVAFGYLSTNRDKLEERTWFSRSAQELSGQWYGMMYLEPASSFTRSHLLTPSLSGRTNLAPGTGDLFTTGTAGVTSLIPSVGVREDIRYVLGLLNSSLLSAYAISHSPVFSGGFYKFSAPYLKGLPIRRIDWLNLGEGRKHDTLVELVDRCCQLTQKLDTEIVPHERTALRRSLEAAKVNLDSLVNDLYGVTAAESRTVELILAEDSGEAESVEEEEVTA